MSGREGLPVEIARALEPLATPDHHSWATFVERPDLYGTSAEMADAVWPEFMLHDPVADELWHHLRDDFPTYQLHLLDPDGGLLAVANSIPLPWDGTFEGLPEGGWDGEFRRAVEAHAAGERPNTLGALQIMVRPGAQGTGLSSLMVRALRARAAAAGLRDLIAPVRPSWKERYPLLPMDRYVTMTRPDGTPFDPWIRVHWRAGAAVLGVCDPSMVIQGSVAEWAAWTGLAFPGSGEYVVPGALRPITIDADRDHGRYVEPNVWMHHRIDG